MFSFMLREALSAMLANRLRSFLTMLGMIIGVAAVILMLAIGAGVQKQVNSAIASMGSNLFIVMPGSTSASGVRCSGMKAMAMTMDSMPKMANQVRYG